MSKNQMEALIADLHDDEFAEDEILQVLLALGINIETATDALSNEPGFW